MYRRYYETLLPTRMDQVHISLVFADYFPIIMCKYIMFNLLYI